MEETNFKITIKEVNNLQNMRGIALTLHKRLEQEEIAITERPGKIVLETARYGTFTDSVRLLKDMQVNYTNNL